MELTIKEHATLAASGALPFAVCGYADLLKKKLASAHTMILHDSYRTLTAHDDKGRIVGVLVFFVYNSEQEFWLQFGHVAPRARRQGVYTALWEKLVEIAKREKRARIGGSTAVENKTLQAFCDKVGRRAKGITYEFEVRA